MDNLPLLSPFKRKAKIWLGREAVKSVPAVGKTTYLEPNNQWYLPVMIGPSTLLPHVIGSQAVRNAITILDQLSPDPYMEFIRNFYRKGLERFGDGWVYADINTVLLGLSKVLGIENYMEIGVRRGRSMTMVASQSPSARIAGFDIWIQQYAGMENPGESLVRSELKRVGHTGDVAFIDGDSKTTVPRYFRTHRDQFFDLITVDGDHSISGARRDLLNVIPRLKVGGVLVFDDTSNQSHPGLFELWQELVGTNARFAAHTFNEVGFGVGFAIKKC